MYVYICITYVFHIYTKIHKYVCISQCIYYMYHHIYDMYKISLLNTHMHTHKTESLTLVYFSPYVKLMKSVFLYFLRGISLLLS